MWGYRGYTQVVDAEVEDSSRFYCQVRGGVASSLVCMERFGGYKGADTVQAEFIRLREMVLRVLPLRMSMSSLRAALGQATPAANEQMCPSGEDPEKYATALCTQVRELLLAAVTPEKGNTSSTLLGEMAALLADQLATRQPVLFDTQILSALFHPLLIYEDSRLDARGGGGISLRLVKSSTSIGGEELDTTESLKALIMPLVELLGDKELESSEVVGNLFSSLLLTYMHVRKHGTTEAMDLNAKNETTSSPFALYEPMKSPTSVEGVEMVLMLLLALIEYLGPSVLRSAATVLQCIGTVLETYNTPAAKLVDTEQQDESVIQTEDDENEEEDEILTICLGVVTTILEAGSSDRSDAEEQQLRAMLPVLEVLSRHPRPEVAELASNARAQILSRGATDASDAKTTRTGEQSFEEVLREAEQDLSSQLVPLRARGVVTLTKLVRRSHSHVHDAEWTPRVHALAQVFLLHLHDSESYVYLAAVQGLAALADAHPNVAVPALVKALQDPENSLESRIKLSEALLFSAKRCGETLPKYGQLFVYAYLDCIRPPPSQRKRVERIQNKAAKRVQLIQEVQSDEEKTAATKELQHPTSAPESEQELLAAATLRASCMSNLAEVCALLQWGLQPFLLDVLTCVFGVLQLELELGGKRRPKPGASDATEDDEQQRLRKQQRVVAVRRGAVFVLRYLVELLGWKMLELMPDQLSPLYHTLKYVARVDRDRVVVFHADRALRALDEVMRSELFHAWSSRMRPSVSRAYALCSAGLCNHPYNFNLAENTNHLGM
ncbi:RNA polymerase II assembly factor Rtp1, C-terminal [Phytophthora cactorum]|nr:RNA polymerase II assembly factor Rtp1, C-terminal [Phytophthora cactorum]